MKRNLLSISAVRVAHALMAAAIVLALTVVMFLIGPQLLGQGAIALLYLVPIGWCTVHWEQSAGVSAALTAALSFDFLFIPPYGTFNIGSPEGWLLFLFIAASILVVGRIKSVLSDAQNRERKATFLYEKVAAIANQQTREGIAKAIADQIQQKFLVQLVQVYLNDSRVLPLITIRASYGTDLSPKNKPDRILPIVSGQDLLGEIDIWKGPITLPSENDPMLQTLLRQGAAALERARTSDENDLLTARARQENGNL